MEVIQAALTATIEFVAIAGITGIIAHALYTWHLSQIPAAPKPNPNYQRSELLEEVLKSRHRIDTTPLATDIPLEEIEQSLAPLPTVGELAADISLDDLLTSDEREEEDLQLQIEIDLNSLDPVALRRLCTQHQINWRNARGYNRHATKRMMIHQLQRRFA